jgi:hypothetical protein
MDASVVDPPIGAATQAFLTFGSWVAGPTGLQPAIATIAMRLRAVLDRSLPLKRLTSPVGR